MPTRYRRPCFGTVATCFAVMLFCGQPWCHHAVQASVAKTRPVELPSDAQPMPDLKVENGTVYQTADSLWIRLAELPSDRRLIVPRLANVLLSVTWGNSDNPSTMTVRPEPNHWVLNLTQPPPESSELLLQLRLDGRPIIFREPVTAKPDEDGVIILPAKYAKTSGEKLRFEPQPHKNTVGYWTVEKDQAEWRFRVTEPGTFDVEILQGCGRGHGGSQVNLQIADQTLSLTVLETGHFQNFRWRHVGRIRLTKTGVASLRLIPVHKAGGAVMDCRQIRLVPAEKPKLRKTGVNADGSRADGSFIRQDRPNVLVILTDDQGTLDAGCYGSRDLFTPRIDGLANDGIRFTQAYSHTVCCPARAMLMTGRHPQRSGINSWTQGNAAGPRGRNMAAAEVTLAETLKSAGYATCLSGKWHLGAALDAGPTTQGFDRFFGLRGGFIDNYNHFYLHGSGFHDLYNGVQEVFHPGRYFPDLMTSHAIQFLNDHARQHPEQPFFLYAAFNLPHYPEQHDTKFDQFYANHKMPRQSYGRAISTVDDRIGVLLDELDRLGLRENTIVVLQSDNGHSEEDYRISVDNHASGLPKGHRYGANGGGGNTGKWRGCKGTLYEGGLRVPAIISFAKALPRGVVRDQAMTLCDWMPTILDLCQIPKAGLPEFDGRSLLPVILNDAESHHTVLHWQWQKRWAVRKDDWKLIGSGGQPVELVCLADAQPETHNYLAEKPELADQLLQLHKTWAQQVQPAAVPQKR